ncbi:carboxymuconolactone decarboxylase family protein [Stappia sp. MMSF_3263]|uniref:carboxymuconolactone decarboxylase family protein n=1 Tax=Stappia sp. MMSF_3263 TaxID=3046693 RepID=UPI00273EB777|nr:carboxymuconolactone decarboxylase family protein [Stappia sp. MMSF_3263]
MSVWPILADEELPARSAAVVADIKATRNTDFINNFWRVLANDPRLLERTWSSLKDVMGPGSIDPLTKEMLYVAVSIVNGCEYCIRSHTAAARAKGMSEEQLGELLAIVGMASETNRLATGLQVPVDQQFLPPAQDRDTQD